MWQGRVVSMNIAPKGGEATTTADEVRAFAGRGLEGDRYFSEQGTFSDTPGTGRQVTLIESEAIDAVVRDCGSKLEYKDSRRNIVTRGVALNDLVGKEFLVGDVRMLGIRLCEPCTISFPDENVKKALVHRGGLRADILNDGTMRVGDVIQER